VYLLLILVRRDIQFVVLNITSLPLSLSHTHTLSAVSLTAYIQCQTEDISECHSHLTSPHYPSHMEEQLNMHCVINLNRRMQQTIILIHSDIVFRLKMAIIRVIIIIITITIGTTIIILIYIRLIF
jgi:hypothetical protein